MAYKWGLRTIYILTGLILQVVLHGYLQNPSFWRRILSPIVIEGESQDCVRRKNSSSRAYKTSMVMVSLSVALIAGNQIYTNGKLVAPRQFSLSIPSKN